MEVKRLCFNCSLWGDVPGPGDAEDGQAGQEGAGLSPLLGDSPAQSARALPNLPGRRCPTCPGCTANEIRTKQADSRENGWRMTGSSVIHPSIQLN